MSSLRGRAALGTPALVVACVVVATAGRAIASSGAPGPPVGGPDLTAMALAPADLGGPASVEEEGYVETDGEGVVAEYDRSYRALSVRLGSKPLVGFENDVILWTSVDRAQDAIRAVSAISTLSADAIGDQLQGSVLKVRYVRIARPKRLGTGDDSRSVTIRLGTSLGEIRFILGAIRVGKVDSLFIVVGAPRVPVAAVDLAAVARVANRQVRAGLAPANVAAPTIAGTAQVGQTLTADPGSWSNPPRAFAFQWQRCDAAGSSCVPLDGATGQTYAVTDSDVGATLGVVVAAGTRYGTATASSVATSVVVAAPPSAPAA